tara:strand:- start:230 stop:736 length:507 start_codon:yes stop_codon:yes gene_type:complete
MGMYPRGNIIKVVPTLDTSAYGAEDLLFDKQEIKNIVPSRGGCSLIHNVSIYADISTDVDLSILFFDNDTSIGANANDAMTEITDAEFKAAGFIGGIQYDFGEQDINVGNGRVYTSNGGDDRPGYGFPFLVKALEGKTSIWFAVTNTQGTPTYAATSLSFTFNVEYLG